MASVNKVIILGHVGSDPEIRTTNGGTTVAGIAVATSRRYKDQSGERQEETEWHKVSLFGRLGEIVQSYVTKGSLIYVEGRLRTRSYTDKNNVERYVTEIIAESLQLMPKGEKSPSNNGSSRPDQSRQQKSSQQQARTYEDDDPPF